jgi:hypothetical protein
MAVVRTDAVRLERRGVARLAIGQRPRHAKLDGRHRPAGLRRVLALRQDFDDRRQHRHPTSAERLADEVGRVSDLDEREPAHRGRGLAVLGDPLGLGHDLGQLGVQPLRLRRGRHA